MEQKHVVRRKRLKKSTMNSSPSSALFLSPNSKQQPPIENNQFQNPLTQQQQQQQPSSSSSENEHKHEQSEQNPIDLPCSILIDILSRLPIRMLVQCSYVCKSWRSLLSESYFYRLYSLHTPTALILNVKGISLDSLNRINLIESSPATMRKIVVSAGSRVDDRRRGNGDQSITRVVPNFRFQLGNGCHGLICLREIRTREPRLVWNPIMGQFVVLPQPGSLAGDKVVSGFGFCGRTHRYKVIRVFRGYFDPPSRNRVEVYELGVGDKWRVIEDAPYPIPSRIPGFYTHNRIHWIIDHNLELICCFDFAEELFRTVPPPPIFSPQQRSKYHWSNLGILGGYELSVCAIDAKTFRPDVQVWVMEDYGVAESWALRLSIRDPTIDWWDPYRWIQVTQFLPNGEILILCGHRYVLAYNARERRFRIVEGLDFPAIAHMPSFISLEDVLKEDLGTGSLIVRYL